MREPKIYEMTGGYGFRLDIGIDPVSGKENKSVLVLIELKQKHEECLPKRYSKSNLEPLLIPKILKLKDFLLQWLEHKHKHVAAGTFAHYKPYVMNHLIPNLGNMKIDQLKPSHIQEMYDSYIEEEILSNQSIVHMHRILNNAFNKAIEWELAIKNPCSVIKPPKPERIQMKVWDEMDVSFFLDFTKEKRFFVAYLLALTTGMRKGEILGLRWQDFDFINSYLSVRQAVTKKKVEAMN